MTSASAIWRAGGFDELREVEDALGHHGPKRHLLLLFYCRSLDLSPKPAVRVKMMAGRSE